MAKKLYKGNLGSDNPDQLSEADIFNIAVQAVGIDNILANKEGTKKKVKEAYKLIKEIAKEI